MLLFLVLAREYTTLMSVSNGLYPSFFCQKMGRTQPMKKEMDGEVFISRQSWHFPFIDNMIQKFSPFVP